MEELSSPQDRSRFHLGTVHSLSEYVATVLTIRRQWSANELWFRGHRRSDYELLPTMYRSEYLRTAYSEAVAFNRFWARGRGLPELAHLGAEHHWDWYFAARHNGLPTRLLDWSLNALVALYFATAEDVPAGLAMNAQVWVLEPIELNRHLYDDPCVLIPYSSASDDFMFSWLPQAVTTDVPSKMEPDDGGRVYSNQWPVAIHPTYTNVRLIAQQGAFTVHGSEPRPLEQLVGCGASTAYLGFVDVHHECIQEIREALELFGKSKFAMMADAQSLAEHSARISRSRRHVQHEKTAKSQKCAVPLEQSQDETARVNLTVSVAAITAGNATSTDFRPLLERDEPPPA